MAAHAKLIALEGTDDIALGSLAESLCRWLRERGVSVECTREPTHGPAGSQVLLARQGRLQLDAVSLALLHLADRLDHLEREEGILSWLAEGRCVVCVHYALHAYARLWGQVEWEWQRRIDASCRAPDLTLLVDLHRAAKDPLQMAYRRAAGRLREGGQAVVVIDGRNALDDVLGMCQRHVVDLFGAG
jgi:thymidylate kinase